MTDSQLFVYRAIAKTKFSSSPGAGRHLLEVTPRKHGYFNEYKPIGVFKHYDWTALSLTLIARQVFS